MPIVCAVTVAAYQPEEESECLRSRVYILEGSRYLPTKFVHQGSKVSGRRLAPCDGTLEGPLEGTPSRGPTQRSAGPPA